MRINLYIAQATGLSRRSADRAIAAGRVQLAGQPATLGDRVAPGAVVTLDGQPVRPAARQLTVMLNKPVGYVCSRRGQGSRTVYDLLPAEYRRLKPVGRLDKDSSGLLLLTEDGGLANELTHPRYGKTKLYQVELDRPLRPADRAAAEQGIELADGLSRLQINRAAQQGSRVYEVGLQEGRNRQVRRTFAALGYRVERLHRTAFGDYRLDGLAAGQYKQLP